MNRHQSVNSVISRRCVDDVVCAAVDAQIGDIENSGINLVVYGSIKRRPNWLAFTFETLSEVSERFASVR